LCGASHSWLIASDELSDLLLYNPFTFAVIPLPPITDLGGVRAVCDHDGLTIVGYDYGNSDELLCRPPNKHVLGCRFYEKVALSCDPSRGGGDCIAMAIYGINQVSFARPGESTWRLALMAQMDKDMYADCVYHNGRFYSVTMYGVVATWDLDTGPAQEPEKHVIINAEATYRGILARFLVSTPWGGLLQIRVKRHTGRYRPSRIKVEVLEVDVEERTLVKLSGATAFREHAVFVGLNESTVWMRKCFRS
jgi:hypothetical protein